MTPQLNQYTSSCSGSPVYVVTLLMKTSELCSDFSIYNNIHSITLVQYFCCPTTILQMMQWTLWNRWFKFTASSYAFNFVAKFSAKHFAVFQLYETHTLHVSAKLIKSPLDIPSLIPVYKFTWYMHIIHTHVTSCNKEVKKYLWVAFL